MDDQLQALADEPLGPGGRARPLDQVVRRGQRLRQRRRAVRIAGPSALVVALLAVGVQFRPADRPEVVTIPSEAIREARAGTRPYFLGCEGTSAEPGTTPPPVDGMRYLPTWLPDGLALDPTVDVPVGPGQVVRLGERVSEMARECRRSDPALVLRAVGDGGVVNAAIKVEGPYPVPIELPDEADLVSQPTELRGLPARAVTSEERGLVAFTWTEVDGTTWWIEGGADEPTLRGVAEALVLDSTTPGSPVATVPPEALPPGFAVTWQATGLPRTDTSDSVLWSVSFGSGGCYVQAEREALDAPAATRGTIGGAPAGSVEVPVRGHEGLVVTYNGGPPEGGRSVTWTEAPDVVLTVGCNDGVDPNLDVNLDAATLVRIAESLTLAP